MTPDDPRHGTYAGASAHRNGGGPICLPCLRAERIRHAQNLAARIGGKPSTVPAVGTVRRLRALQAIGWPIAEIARRADMYEKTLRNPIMRGSSVYRATAEKVAAVYDELCMTRPEGGYYERCRRMAERRGFAPPLAWDDIDNDPEPQGMRRASGKRADLDENVVTRVLAGEWRMHTTPAEKAEIARRWVARGGSAAQLAGLTGWRVERYYRVGEGGAA